MPGLVSCAWSLALLRFDMGGAAFQPLASCIQASASLQDLQVRCRSINKSNGMGQALLEPLCWHSPSTPDCYWLMSCAALAALLECEAPRHACVTHLHSVLQLLATSLTPFSIMGYNPGKGALDAVLRRLVKGGQGLSPDSARSLLWALAMLQATHKGARPTPC